MSEPSKPAPIALPVFGPKVLFFDVDGDPVSFDKGVALRWVDGNPEPMSAASAARGVAISAARFRELVAAQTAGEPVDLKTIPLEQFADLAATAIAANLRSKTAKPRADLSQAELLDAARAALLARFRLEPCAMPYPRPYGPAGDYAYFLIIEQTSNRFGASQYVAVDRATGKAFVFESGE
jgi:hypothetical protein